MSITLEILHFLEVVCGTADIITDTLFHYLCDYAKLNLDKLPGGASDGASIMTGIHNGVMARIKAHLPHFISTHCSAHRLSSMHLKLVM